MENAFTGLGRRGASPGSMESATRTVPGRLWEEGSSSDKARHRFHRLRRVVNRLRLDGQPSVENLATGGHRHLSGKPTTRPIADDF
jgi:hypothetical protein